MDKTTKKVMYIGSPNFDKPKYKAILTGFDGKEEIVLIGDEGGTSVNQYSSVDVDIRQVSDEDSKFLVHHKYGEIHY